MQSSRRSFDYTYVKKEVASMEQNLPQLFAKNRFEIVVIEKTNNKWLLKSVSTRLEKQ